MSDANANSPVFAVHYPDGKSRTFDYDSNGSLLRVHQPDGETWQRVAEDLWQTRAGLMDSQVKVNQQGTFSYTHWVNDEFVKSTTFASGNEKEGQGELRGTDLGRAVEKFKAELEKNGSVDLTDLKRLKAAADKNLANTAREQVVQTLVNHFDQIRKLEAGSQTGKISDAALNKFIALEKESLKEERQWREAADLINHAPLFLQLDKNGQAHVSAEALKKWQNYPANSMAVNNSIDFLLDKLNSGQDLTRNSVLEKAEKLSASPEYRLALDANFKHSSISQEIDRKVADLKLEAELFAVPAAFSAICAVAGAEGAEVPLFFTGLPAASKVYQTWDEYKRSSTGIEAARRYQFEKGMPLD